jgi:hypothetical protein
MYRRAWPGISDNRALGGSAYLGPAHTESRHTTLQRRSNSRRGGGRELSSFVWPGTENGGLIRFGDSIHGFECIRCVYWVRDEPREPKTHLEQVHLVCLHAFHTFPHAFFDHSTGDGSGRKHAPFRGADDDRRVT